MSDSTSDSGKTVAPGGKVRRAHDAVFGAACALVIGVFAWSARSGMLELWGGTAPETYYNLLVRGFRDGQLNVKREAPAQLAQLADPGDPAANNPYRWMAGQPVHDLSYYQGKLYLYFGITPALTLFWPYSALTGRYLLHKEAVVFFCAAGFLASAGLLRALGRRYFAEVGVGVMGAGTLALGLAPGLPVMMARSDVYEVSISCGYALTMLAVAAIWRALHEANRRSLWLAAASLAYGLAVGARPALLFGAVILLMSAVQAWRAGAAAGSRRQIWVLFLAAAGPIMLIGMGLMLYNDLRFGSPLEFGQRYQLAAERQDTMQHFSPRYLWFNFRVYFLEPARWSGHFPFVQGITSPRLPAGHAKIEHPFGVLASIPLVWLALAAPLAWRGRPAAAGSTLRWLLASLVLLFGVCALTLGLYNYACVRYEVEFVPALVLLAVIGILGLERALAGQPAWRHTARWGWGLLLAWSVAFNLFARFELYAETQNNLGDALLQNGRVNEAITCFQKALHSQPDSANAYNHLGVALLQTGRVDEAMVYYQKALALQPDFAEAHNNLGNALLQKGSGDEAIAHFQKALELQSDYANARYNLGNALVQKGRVDEAISHYQQVLKIQPGFAEAHNNLGSLLLQKGQVDEAMAHFRTALEIQPDNATAQYNLGAALLQKGQVKRQPYNQ